MANINEISIVREVWETLMNRENQTNLHQYWQIQKPLHGIVESFVIDLSKKIENENETFKGKVIAVGSSYEQTSVGPFSPMEFDFNIELESFSDLITVSHTGNLRDDEGYRQLLMKNDSTTPESFKQYFTKNEGNAFLDVSKVKLHFYSLVVKVLYSNVTYKYTYNNE
jgi:hypothetical protein